MAKLNGVKTVSERIQYNGAEYVKSDEAAVVGDIIRFDDSSSYLTTGAFYEVTRVDSLDDPQVIDDDGDEYDLCGEDITVFKRVEVVATEPVDSEDKQKAVVGDKIRVVNAWGTLGKYENGDEFVAKSVRNDGAVFVSEHDRPIALNEYEIITIPQYREVNRKANVGERIRIVKTVVSNRGFSVGDEFTVNRVDTDGSDDVRVTLNGDDRKLVVRSEYVVLEPVVADAKKAPEPRLKVGEYAKVLKNSVGNAMTSGDIIQITFDGGGDHMPYKAARLSDGKLSNWIATYELVRATDAEVAEAKRKNVKVGDYVNITEYQGAAPASTIVKVTHVSKDMVTYEWDGSRGLLSTKFEPVTPAEAGQVRKEQAEAAAKAAETAKWTAIGRKVGEFKAGDIVRSVSRAKDEAGIGEVVGVDGDKYRVNYHGSFKICTEPVNFIELIAPVESLFSR